MFLKILQLTLLASVVLCETLHDKEIQTTAEDSRFLVIKVIDGLFSYAEETASLLVTNLVTIVKHFDTSVQFIFDSFSTVIDVLIRWPAYVITQTLYFVSLTIDLLVYILLDLAYHYMINVTFSYIKWTLINLLYFLTDFIYYSLHSIIYILKTFVLTYVYIFTSIFVYIITQFFQSVFWILSFVTVGYFSLWAITEIWLKIRTEGGSKDDLFLIFLLLPLAYILFNVWFVFCSFIFNFICYPIMILLYCCLVGFITFYLGAEFYNKCQQYTNVFDKDTLVGVLREILSKSKSIFIVFGVDGDEGQKQGQDQSIVTEETDYTDVECIVCFEETQLVKLLPCQHKIMCYNCTIRILETDYRCPICRAAITYYQIDR